MRVAMVQRILIKYLSFYVCGCKGSKVLMLKVDSKE